MSTKAKIGKDWVKCQVILQGDGEVLHLTFAPGETRKKVVAHIDGRTDVGYFELTAIEGAQPPHDATLSLVFKNEGVHKQVAKPPAPPKPAPVPVVEELPPPPEEIIVSEVQEPAVESTTASGGKRGAKRGGQGQS